MNPWFIDLLTITNPNNSPLKFTKIKLSPRVSVASRSNVFSSSACTHSRITLYAMSHIFCYAPLLINPLACTSLSKRLVFNDILFYNPLEQLWLLIVDWCGVLFWHWLTCLVLLHLLLLFSSSSLVRALLALLHIMSNSYLLTRWRFTSEMIFATKNVSKTTFWCWQKDDIFLGWHFTYFRHSLINCHLLIDDRHPIDDLQ